MKSHVMKYLEYHLKGHTGKNVSFFIETDDCLINVHGKFHKHGDQYLFTKGKRKFIIEKKRVGSVWSWGGAHNEYWIELTESGQTLFEFRIPKDVNLQLENDEF